MYVYIIQKATARTGRRILEFLLGKCLLSFDIGCFGKQAFLGLIQLLGKIQVVDVRICKTLLFLPYLILQLLLYVRLDLL